MTESRVQRRERERREEASRAQVSRSGSKERRRGSERKKRGKKIAGLIVLVIVVALGLAGLRVYMESRPGAVEPIVLAGSGEFADDNRINILFFGSHQGLTDTIMFFSLDFENSRLDQVSIPRDTYYSRANYPGAAYQKINSVYGTEGYVGACKAVSNVLGGVPIHYFVTLGPDGVKKIVDVVGGVWMDIPMDMYYVDVDQNLYIDLKAGPQLLNGEQTMQYLRFRSGYANGDLGRISAQQEFLKAVLAQGSGFDYPRIVIAARNEAKTNMSLSAQAGLMARAAGMKNGVFYTYTIPGSAGMQDGLSYFFHDAAATKELMRQIYNGG